MQFTRELRRLWAGLLIAFAVMMIASTYWAIVGADTLLQREDNPRQVEVERRILRGAMIANDGTTTLADTTLDDNGIAQRRYPVPSAYSALGYFSFRYGEGGAEQAYNALLRGEAPLSIENYWAQNVLHLPKEGNDIQLTLDVMLQNALYEQLQGHRGASVVMDAQTGAILGLVSLPTYDPNTLDADWETLTKDTGQPFFNRVTQGQYQAGGIAYTPLMALANLSGYNVQTLTINANTPVVLSDVILTCVVAPPKPDLTLLEAYQYGCPKPFVNLIASLQPNAISAFYSTLRLNTAPLIEGWAQTLPPLTPTATPELITDGTPIPNVSFLDDVLGQGAFTANPLAVAQLMSAIALDGSAPTPILHQATRPKGKTDWQPVLVSSARTALLTSETAQQLRDWMVRTQPIVPEDEGILSGRQTVVAYSGEDVQTWFVGFVVTNGRVLSVVIVLENEVAYDDLNSIAQQVIEILGRDSSDN